MFIITDGVRRNRRDKPTEVKRAEVAEKQMDAKESQWIAEQYRATAQLMQILQKAGGATRMENTSHRRRYESIRKFAHECWASGKKGHKFRDVHFRG